MNVLQRIKKTNWKNDMAQIELEGIGTNYHIQKQEKKKQSNKKKQECEAKPSLTTEFIKGTKKSQTFNQRNYKKKMQKYKQALQVISPVVTKPQIFDPNLSRKPRR